MALGLTPGMRLRFPFKAGSSFGYTPGRPYWYAHAVRDAACLDNGTFRPQVPGPRVRDGGA